MGRGVVTRVGESACLLQTETGDGALAALDTALERPPRNVRDLVPGARTLLIVFHAPPGDADLSWLDAVARAAPRSRNARGTARTHEIAVRYDGEDLAAVARHAGLPVDEAISLHASARYRVAFVGFQPGFAYLDGLPPALRMPRRPSPRPRVPAGSVAIGGEWTGIYPAAGPGGWNLIGSADVALFDATADRPALLEPGDVVCLVPR